MIRIKELRNEKGLSQEELGNFLNIQKSAISKYERGALEPNKTMLIKMSEFFNCSVDYLLGLSDVRNADRILNSVSDDKVLADFTKELMERESMQLLFKQSKNLSDSDINKIIKIIKAIEDEEDKQTGVE
ncbi:helix-turn-helix transcriptional regulator [Niameybacter massiliensis]|uniref:Helix-turn-helix transcriptional regulator n=1 Tax=Holtiella tumoricola TaxID=3018743 RepID=A0AA42DR74_9FIRM|nr:helix-turn-helix transcriptional regulator [Holtiella tumoricola]MDA3733612.1 helix-turn-helix transcriptional regulator [Holtiella tumoricola]